MSPLNIILNVLWILTGGVWMAVAWLVAAVIMAITIIGLPWARAAFNIAIYTFLPFGTSRCRGTRSRGARTSAPGRSACSATSSGSCSPAGGWRSAT